MRSSGALRQLLRSLCHNTCWNYAVFWKLEPRNHMLLTLEDSYFDNSKSSDAAENISFNTFVSDKPGTISFDREIDAECGNFVGCPMEVAVANLSCHTYLLGHGIVGKVALQKNHCWIFASQYNSKFQPECFEECQLQFAAGIKTILLVPFVPRGVLQLGSLNTVMEHSAMVAHIEDLFLKHIDETCHSFVPRLDLLNPCTTPISMPPIVTPSSSALYLDLLDPVHSSFAAKKDATSFYSSKLMKNEFATTGTQFQTDHVFSQEVTVQVFEVTASSCTNESAQMAVCGNLVFDPTEKLCFLNKSVYTDDIVVADISKVPRLEDELRVASDINQRLISKQVMVSNPCIRDQEHSDLRYIEQLMGEEFQRELSLEARSIIDGRDFNFPFHSELHKALQPSSFEEHGVWNSTVSKLDDSISSTVSCQTENLGAFGLPVEKYSEQQIMQGSEIEHLLDAMIDNLRNASNDVGNFPDSCLTQYCTSSIFGLEDSTLCRYIAPASFPKTNREHDKEGLPSYPSSKRKRRINDLHKPRPRDRQLIQDRLKELRELIPNGEKCSIDVLLDRTIKHMLFLGSVPCRAEKLRSSGYSKIKYEHENLTGSRAFQNGASFAYEVGVQPEGPELCPLIVENLGKTGQILIEMLCKEYGLFLEVAQVIKCLKLTILKGVLESRSDKLWAHFVIEGSRGFHRLDILLPLMQLLQRN